MSTGQQFERPAKMSAEQAASVRGALELLISSDAFSGSRQCQDFLRLAVERALAGEVDTLSERMIGVEMFGRPADFDTSNDGVVRVRAAEVRKRLAQYYRQIASSPLVQIELLPGSYVPEFHWTSQARVEDKTGATPSPTPVAPPWRLKPVLTTVAVLGIFILGVTAWLQLRPKSPSINAV